MIVYGIGNSRVEYHPKSVKKEVKVQFEFLTLNSHGSTSQTQDFGLLENRPPSLSRSIKLELLHIVIYEKRRERGEIHDSQVFCYFSKKPRQSSQ